MWLPDVYLTFCLYDRWLVRTLNSIKNDTTWLESEVVKYRGQIAWATELAEKRVPEVLDHNSFLFNVALPVVTTSINFTNNSNFHYYYQKALAFIFSFGFFFRNYAG